MGRGSLESVNVFEVTETLMVALERQEREVGKDYKGATGDFIG